MDFQDDPKPARKGIPADLQKRHTAALAQFKASASFFSKQREREVADLRFVDFDEQWDPSVVAQRKGKQAVNGLPPTPDRPTLTINQLRAPCQQVANTRRNARLALQFAPKGGGATQDIAEVYEDIARAIQSESRAAIARNWAADRAEKCGTGWYRIDTDYATEQPTDEAAWNDQEIVYRRILNQASVYPDPLAQEPDFSDGRRLFVTQDLPFDQFQIDYPDSDLGSADAVELTAIGDQLPHWVFPTADGESDQAGVTVRVAEYWEVVEQTRTKVMLTNGTAAFDDEIPDGIEVASGPHARTRKIRTRTIYWSKINAMEYLEGPVEWNGTYIPIIPVVGEESNVNGERRWTGIVRPAKDAAVSYNVMRSAQVEAIGLATKAPYVGYFETIEPYLEWWKQSNVRNFFMLPIKAVKDAAGNFLPPPKRNVEEPAIQAITLAAHEARDDVHATTGIPPVALGQLDPHDRSGKAIQALQGQSEVGSSGYLDSYVQISLHYDGKVMRDLIPRIFDRPKRIVPAVGVDEKRRLVMLNWPFQEGKDGQPVAIEGWQTGMPIPEGAKYYDLAAGEYSIAPTVGKSYATRREEASAAIGNVLQVVPPEMAAAIAPAWLEEQDYPGAKKIAEIAKKALPPPLQAAYQDDNKQPQIPPEIQAQMQQMQAENSQLKQMVEQEQAKQQGALQKAQMDNAARLQIATETNASRERIAADTNAVKLTDIEARINAAVAQAMISYQTQQQEQVHQVGMASLQQAHTLEQGDQQHGQALQQGAQAHDQALQQGDVSHQQNLEAGAQQHAAALEQQAAQPPAGAGA